MQNNFIKAKRHLQGAFLHWWVVQDDSAYASPYGSLPLATLSHCVRLELRQVRTLHDFIKAKRHL
ncbi:hypothetical protein BG55_13670 [Erwinia mallotivora]|uniref:Uncharacterized protein n=1 Tax=Erwinia mallotivora TaxID=69222 RepID=A0A014PVY3_9GAMM|nr:hypothetical protein BG55_13670 [Erwinia mallotivora]